MGEDSIRGKLGNSRIGVAITADIRPLNHPALQPYSCPILPVCPCVSTSSSSLSLQNALVFETLSDRKSSISQPILCGLLAELLINQALFSHSTERHIERRTHYLHCLDQGLVLLILQRASVESLTAVGSGVYSHRCMCKSVPVKSWQREQVDWPPYIHILLIVKMEVIFVIYNRESNTQEFKMQRNKPNYCLTLRRSMLYGL